MLNDKGSKSWRVSVSCSRLGLMLTATVLSIGCQPSNRPAPSLTDKTSPAQSEAPTTTSEFQPTVENRDPSRRRAPDGKVWIPGGEFSMGAGEPPDMDDVGMKATLDARPIHRVYVDGFYMDKTDVTNAQFSRFVKATGYVTVAERTPSAEDFPSAPPEKLVAGGVVFAPPNHPVSLDNHLQWWSYVKGANWRHPTGPQSDIRGKGDFPVVQIAYEDAEAYA